MSEKKSQESSFERIFSENSTQNIVGVRTDTLTMALYSARLIHILTGVSEDHAFDAMYKLAVDVENGHTVSPDELEAFAAIMMEMSREQPVEGEHVN